MFLYTLLLLLQTVLAWDAPQYPGFDRVWQSHFIGNEGSLPNASHWVVIEGDLGVNNELQIYAKNTRNVQLSGGETLQIIPRRDDSAPRGWTSGRIESSYIVTPAHGQVTRVESVLRFGENPGSVKQGLWPAFWMLGDSIRRGTPWPFCGEIDILENTNGQPLGHGTLHYNLYPGITAGTAIPDRDWHTWRVEIDRRSDSLEEQDIRWYVDGREYHRVPSSRIRDPEAWGRLAHSPYFLILNMAVGGNWPGDPDINTLDGYGSMVECGYVAHYSSKVALGARSL